MHRLIFIIGLLISAHSISYAQDYHFKDKINNEALPVISQGRSGTCWSFATSSFLESEVHRLTGKSVDLSEIYPVRITYEDKAWNYVMRQGKTQLSEGGLAHDVLNATAKAGLVPDMAFDKKVDEKGQLNHSGVIKKIKDILDDYIKNGNKSSSTYWKDSIGNILDKMVGKTPHTFTYEGKEYTPESFRDYLHIDPGAYITLTSFTHKPYYRNFILNIPDNFSNGSFYNLPLDELVDTSIEALKKGYTLSLDADVSEETFSPKYGIAVLPKEKKDSKKCLTEIVPELEVTPDTRQKEFENYHTTDDHLMHITGLVEDSKGNLYFKVKNSWGTDSKRVGNGGYIYMSIPYFKMKTISVLVHKSALPCSLFPNNQR